MIGTQAIEHGSSRGGRWLQDRRIRIVLAIAAVEGILYLLGVLSWWFVVLLAAVGLLLWAYSGRTSGSHLVRQATWIFAASQVMVLLVPLAFWVLKAAAIGLVALIAIAALVILLRTRP